MIAEGDVERVRLSIYRAFASTGVAPGREELVERTSLSREAVDEAFIELARQRHLALGSAGEIAMAHPFASMNLGFSVMGERTLWWGGCAWDSFAIPHLVPGEPSVLVATTCPACATAHAWTVDNVAAPAGTQVAHFATPMAHVWDDVVHACANQRIFCDAQCVAAWLERSGTPRGETFDLTTLWNLASHWYEGRLDSPYVRREPVQAAEYFASVGLVGEFWGNQPSEGHP